MTRYSYSGGALQAVLVTPMSVSAPTQIEVQSLLGWPTGTNGPFWVVIDKDTENEEKILCSSATGDFLTIVQRGVDDTAAVAHAADATVEHVFTATEADQANEHVNATSGVHGLGNLDSVVGQVAFDAHTSAVNDTHGVGAPDRIAGYDEVMTEVDNKIAAAFVVGEVRMFFSLPALWVPCDGRALSATLYPDLFALLGYTYGGSGDNFNVPDVQGRVPRGGTPGTSGGSDTITLSEANLPPHVHSIDHDHGAGTTDEVSSQVRVRMGDNIEPEADSVGGAGDVWTNNNPNRVASSGGAGGTTVESDAYSEAHGHTASVPAHTGNSSSVGAGTPITTVPSHTEFIFGMYAGA